MRGGNRRPRAVGGANGGAVGTDLGDLDGYIGFYLRIAQDASFRAFARTAHARNLKPGRFAALEVIARNPGIGQSELGRAIARDKSTVTPLIQELRERQLIRRHRNARDGRRAELFLTGAGRAYLSRIRRHARRHDGKLDRIVGADKAAFIGLLKRIADELA